MGRFAVQPGKRAQKYRQLLGNLAYGAGTTPKLAGGLPKSDYLTSLDLISNMQVVTGATAPVIANYGAYGPLGLISFKVGSKAPFALPGYHANEYAKVWNHDYFDVLAADPVPINSTNSWKNHLRIPLTVDPLSEIGAWYLGDVTLSANIQYACAAPATVFSTVNGATIQGSHDVWGEKFSAQSPEMDGGWLNEISYYKETTLYTTAQLKNGTTNVTLDIDKDYLRLIFIFYTGSNQDATFAPADGLYNWIDLAVDDKLHIFEQVPEAQIKFNMLQNYGNTGAGLTVKAGTAVLDFMEQFNSRRDVLPSDSPAVKSLVLRINSNSASNFVDVITESVTDNPAAVKYAKLRAQAQKAG